MEPLTIIFGLGFGWMTAAYLDTRRKLKKAEYKIKLADETLAHTMATVNAAFEEMSKRPIKSPYQIKK